MSAFLSELIVLDIESWLEGGGGGGGGGVDPPSRRLWWVAMGAPRVWFVVRDCPAARQSPKSSLSGNKFK